MSGAVKKRYNPQKYLAERRSDPARKQQALKEASAVARFIRGKYGAEVYGIGSLFEPERSFSKKSDIDLVVKGLPEDRFFSICAEAAELTRFSLDIIPYEDANELVRADVRDRGVPL